MNGEHTAVIYGKHYPNRLFVGCLPPEAAPEDLGKFFNKFDHVLEAKIVLDNEGLSKRFGFVTFKTSEKVAKLIKLRSIAFQGKMINIGPAVKKNFDVDGQPKSPSQPIVRPKQPSVGPLHTPKTVVWPKPRMFGKYSELCGSDVEPWKWDDNSFSLVWGISNQTQSIWNSSDNFRFSHHGGARNTAGMASDQQISNANQASQYASNSAAVWTPDTSEYYGLPNLAKLSPIGHHMSLPALQKLKNSTESTSPGES